MKEFIIYIVKSGVCLSIFLLIYQIFLRRATFFRFNRAYLVSGLIASFIIPAIPYTYDVYISTNQLIPNVSVIADTNISTFLYIDIWLMVGAIYLLGCIVVLMHNIQSARRFIVLTRGNKTVDCGKYKLIDNAEIKSPFSIVNYIMLSTQILSTAEKELILKHEITHINQKHWIDLLCGEVLLMLQWFNPIAWKYVKAQKENHEFLADKAVIDTGISPALYRAVLINQRFQGSVFSFSNSFNYSKPLNRLIMITKSKSSPWKKIAVLAALPLFSIFIWASAKPNYVMEKQILMEERDSVLILDQPLGLYNVDGIPMLVDDVSALEMKNSQINIQSIDYETLGTKIGSENSKNVVYSNPDSNQDDKKNGIILRTDSDISKVLIIIDNKESTLEEMNLLDTSNIESISVLKDESTKEYGEKGKHGVIIVETKK